MSSNLDVHSLFFRRSLWQALKGFESRLLLVTGKKDKKFCDIARKMRAACNGKEEEDEEKNGRNLVEPTPDTSFPLLPPITPQFESEEEFEASWQAFVGQTKQKIQLEEAFSGVSGGCPTPL